MLIIIHCFSGPHGEKIIFGYLDELQIRRTRVSQEHEICQSLRKCESMFPSIHLRVGVNVSKVYTQKKNGNFASNYGCSKMSFISLFKCPYLTQQVEHKIEICASSSDYLLIKIMEGYQNYTSNPIIRVILCPQKNPNHIRSLMIIDKYFHVLLYY